MIDFDNKETEYKLNLIGGGSRKYTYEGINFSFEYFKDGDTIHYTLNTIDKIKECVVIIISKNEHYYVIADIYNISFFGKYPHVGHLTNNGGSFLLNLATNFIKSISEEYNIKYIQLQDNAQKTCNNKKMKVWLLSTLKYGFPWYYRYHPKKCIKSVLQYLFICVYITKNILFFYFIYHKI